MKYLNQIVLLQEHIEKQRARRIVLQSLKATGKTLNAGIETQQQLDFALNTIDQYISTSLDAIRLLSEDDFL